MAIDHDLSQFDKDLHELGITLSDLQKQQFVRYYELLIEWNSFMNLTAITDFDEVFKKHFVDSLSLIKVADLDREFSVIDVGTGAGFPGLCLKIAFPKLHITLLDSLNKRLNFLNEVIDDLGLKDIKTIHGRAEDIAKKSDYREQFDISVSRAVANLTTLSEYCLPFVKVGGRFIAYKSEKIEEEKKTASSALKILGGEFESEESFYLPGSDLYRNLYSISKVSKTPGKYPRKAGLPLKEPLK
ncbi:MAG: 16S rRNA (guanine(527)-N(7))-methyltransferase RsmG [Acetatifactor sp.]|nr:16S rRNA (guanine(527)-N(7))-methyltransferase RsmG [Acetatifactor sp.]